jgi:hypothetical protein
MIEAEFEHSYSQKHKIEGSLGFEDQGGPYGLKGISAGCSRLNSEKHTLRQRFSPFRNQT